MDNDRLVEIKRDLERGGDAAQWPSAAVEELVAEVERLQSGLAGAMDALAEARNQARGPVTLPVPGGEILGEGDATPLW